MKTQHEIKLYYNNLAGGYDKDRFDNSYGRYIDQQEKIIISRLLKDTKKSETLDLACGTGRFLEYAQHAADISPEMLNEARSKYPDKIFDECNALDTQFEDNRFSTILSFHFIMHLDSEATKQFILETHRILKPGGKLIFDFPSKSRRQIIGYKSKGWHASNSLTIEEIKKMCSGKFNLNFSCGILFFPIHRFPKKIRRFLRNIDSWFCRSYLRKYASYIIVELEKI